MRFKAWRGISDTYRAAVEGHTPWRPDSPDPQPFVVADVTLDAELAAYQPVFTAERIRALGFIPLVSRGRVIGKFMLYFDAPTTLAAEDCRTGRRDCRAGRLRGGTDAGRRAGAHERGAAAFRARRRDDGHLGLGPRDQHRAVVRQPGADPRAAPGDLRRHVRQLRARDPSRRPRAGLRIGAACAGRRRRPRDRISARRAGRLDPLGGGEGPGRTGSAAGPRGCRASA